MSYHESVLSKESIDGLDVKPDGIYVDVTFGGGGHSKEILKKLETGRLVAFDQDEDVLKNALKDERFTLVNANFRFLKNFLMYYKALPVDGIIADLGISSHQIDDPDRGFSTRFDSELDLRMDRKGKLDAKDILNDYSSEEISALFFKYGEMQNAKRLANAIVRYRKDKKIHTVPDLKNAIGKFAKKGKENKFYAKVFQALRIEINNEMDSLKDMLLQSKEVLNPGGKLVVISYHSLEDRLVKNFMRAGNFEGIVEKDFYGNEITPFKMITRKPIVPGQDELDRNKRSRSAKLRIAIKN
ncbi:MAG: 16S rRNA (cytosine(1402)-N(4))-methyltransferase RsmH [Bacteroidales bacterium]